MLFGEDAASFVMVAQVKSTESDFVFPANESNGGPAGVGVLR